MYTMADVAARERVGEDVRRTRRRRLAREVSAHQRWERIGARAQAAQSRHARRVQSMRVH